MNKYVIIFILLLTTAIGYLFVENKNLNRKYETSIENIKAYDNILSNADNETRALKLTVRQLNHLNDSILQKINEVKKNLKIKDSNLKQIQYLLSEATKKDTIVFRDTLFREPTLDIDTLVGDKWYQMKLGLKYPSTITTDPKFVSEKYIMVDYKKETINPPKKCWLLRLFQKKHKVVEVNVVEKNPYIENKQQRFIEIVE